MVLRRRESESEGTDINDAQGGADREVIDEPISCNKLRDDKSDTL
jgi:hypothetical protein